MVSGDVKFYQPIANFEYRQVLVRETDSGC